MTKTKMFVIRIMPNDANDPDDVDSAEDLCLQLVNLVNDHTVHTALSQIDWHDSDLPKPAPEGSNNNS